ncbi:CxxxxCH/CxxCH domain-containing protein [Geobacter sp. AOG1]|uniref:CxxxxCH/CxxCH domain c-type cytochrome n=1 Tax=Geobacter sp. AOG1 TaxID=1566346 RepID=UPI001CC3AA91|nr:CxxxxCH/CxxCH domain-containing protein [Geobacter sp. AOG1]GFE56433.1 hypothetical protein AOG1_03120 [Geobacter sp. AOG1]
MKRLIAAWLFVLLVTSMAQAVDSPHVNPSASCAGCHVLISNGAGGYTIDYSSNVTGVNNLCLSCHNPGLLTKSFSPKDIANPFGSTNTGVTSGQMQTSHNWAAPVNVPAAGAATPVDPYMSATMATQQGVISCASCHSKHATAGNNLLRFPNDTDLLCFDCHRSRNKRDQMTGTHPVNFTYTSATSKVKLKPADYLPLPLNANSANPTAAMKLPAGQVLCTTCHGVHFTDSNARTFDNASSAIFGRLSSSQGYLLRTDMRSGTANGVNICTNCHANKTAHNNKGQNIQCADCHAAHVDPGDGTTPNVWLVRRYMNYSGGVKLDSYRRKVLNQFTDAQSNWAGGYGVCQGCHNVPVGNSYPTEHTSTNPDVCRSCHSHGSKIGSFSADCQGCHGFPPVQNTPGGPNGYAVAGNNSYANDPYFKDESNAGHRTHAGKVLLSYGCNECHAGNTHGSGNFQQVFKATSNIIAATGGATPMYNASTGTCSNVYCHSNGRQSYASPLWSNASTGACGTCHATTPYIGGPFISSNAHFPHFSSNGSSYGPMLTPRNATSCQTCHTAFTGEFGATHVDGTVQVISSCNPCHRQAGTYVWTTGPVSCESCHTGILSEINGVTAPDKSRFTNLGHGQFTGKSDQCLNCHVRSDRHITSVPGTHVTRLGSSYQGIGQNDLCASCHNNAAIVTTTARQNMSTHVSTKTDPPQPNLCSACHDVHGSTNLNAINAQIAFKPGSTAIIAFTNTSTGFVNTKTNRGLCQICHTQTNHYKRDVAETSHPTKTCLACHDHKDSYAFKPNGNCDTCHGYPPVSSMAGRGVGGNYSSARLEVFNGGGYTNGGGAHTVSAHVNPNAVWQQAWTNCGVCHDSSKHRMIMPLQQKSLNVTLDPTIWTNSTIPAAYTGPLNGSGTGALVTGSCTNIYCHSNGNGAGPNNTTFTWSSPQGTLGCTGCHGNNAASSNPITTGKHTAHTSTAMLGTGNAFGCVECHAKTVDSDTHISNPQNHVNKFKDYSGAKAGGSANYNATTRECSNFYCHSNGNKGALLYSNPAAWNSATTYGCNGCHGTSNALGAPDYANGGSATGTANSHNAHTAGYTDTSVCSNCHFITASTTGGKLVNNSAHLNRVVNVVFNPAVAGANASYDPTTGRCANISCHGNAPAQWGDKAGCLGCHAVSIGGRAAITPQFSGNSHHVQGPNVDGTHCYQCHWEANSDGSINHAYHHSSTPDAPVELVVYGAGARPMTYTVGTTAVQYTANGSRTEMAKINAVCLGCHNDQNKAIQPFGDGKTPSVYAWDASSIGAKYGDAGTTPWGKYNGGNTTPKDSVTKAFSAHGNAVNNKGGWDTSETWTDRNATANVLCFDCHNSHGSNINGTTTSYTSATYNGGILKETVAGNGGYSVTYKPASGGSAATLNAYNPGAGLCFDCHLNPSLGSTPWGYNTTFNSTQQIMNYFDTAYFGNYTSGPGHRYPYKAALGNMGGHFGASSPLSVNASRSIQGLCTPCHDPHGVSPTLGTNKQYSVPLLKGTWLTSPYKEDVATADNVAYRYMNASASGDDAPQPASGTANAYLAAKNSYKIDQNTFASGSITETDQQFAGLCLNCHAKQTLTDGTNHTWKSKDRIHESVKGWKTANATVKHTYSCSKCHAPHNATLPRLMVTNCLDGRHRGQVPYNSNSITSGSGTGSKGNGSGGMPGFWAGGREGDHGGYSTSSSDAPAVKPSPSVGSCHEGNDTTQQWNVKTPWGSATTTTDPSVPVLISEPNGICSSSCSVTLQWNASTNPGGGAMQYLVQVSSSSTFATVNYSSGWISGTSYTRTLANGTWYWRVQARDAVAITRVSAWSTVGNFTLSSSSSSSTPTTPVLIAEADSTCSGSCATTLAWNASTISSGTIQYSVQVSSSSSFSTVTASSGWINATSWTPNLGAGTWYWRVQARNATSTSLVSSWSTVDSFVISAPATANPPTAPVLAAEPNGRCSTYSGCSIGLTWSPSTNPSGGSIQYLVQVSSSSSFSSIKTQSSWQTGTSWNATLPSGTWYWRVQARDATSQKTSPWSTVDSFVLSRY